MKFRLHSVFFLVAVPFLSPPALAQAPEPKTTVSLPEQEALNRFKGQLEEIHKWGVARRAELKDDPLLKSLFPIEFVAKLKAVPSDGLPNDLKTAWDQFMSQMGKFETVLKKVGPPDKQLERSLSSPYAAQELQKEVQGAIAELKKSAAALEGVGKKYGLNDIGLK